MVMDHLSDDTLERYCLNTVYDRAQLTLIEGHLLVCHSCIERAEEAERYVKAMRSAIVRHDLDLEVRDR